MSAGERTNARFFDWDTGDLVECEIIEGNGTLLWVERADNGERDWIDIQQLERGRR